MKCNAAAYEGTDPYIFISYCHLDQDRVYPYIEMLERDGYRLWYDEGITPGDEWTEIIAKHLENSQVFVAFVTEASLNSHNCRREINFAIQRDKPFVSLFLDDVSLSAGMEMLLSNVQGIYRSKYELAEDFLRKLCENDKLSLCRGQKPMRDKPLSMPIDTDETVTLTQGSSALMAQSYINCLFLVHNREKIVLGSGPITLGRSADVSDYAFTWEPSISRKHATVRYEAGTCTITDNRSLNHVGINGRQIAPDVEYELGSFDIISLAKEHLVYLRNYNEADAHLRNRYSLRSRDVVYAVESGPVVRIGSLPPGEGGKGNEICIGGSGIADYHAILINTPKGLMFADISGAGNCSVKGRNVNYCEKVLIEAGDEIRIGNQSFELIRGV